MSREVELSVDQLERITALQTPVDRDEYHQKVLEGPFFNPGPYIITAATELQMRIDDAAERGDTSLGTTDAVHNQVLGLYSNYKETAADPKNHELLKNTIMDGLNCLELLGGEQSARWLSWVRGVKQESVRVQYEKDNYRFQVRYLEGALSGALPDAPDVQRDLWAVALAEDNFADQPEEFWQMVDGISDELFDSRHALSDKLLGYEYEAGSPMHGLYPSLVSLDTYAHEVADLERAADHSASVSEIRERFFETVFRALDEGDGTLNGAQKRELLATLLRARNHAIQHGLTPEYEFTRHRIATGRRYGELVPDVDDAEAYVSTLSHRPEFGERDNRLRGIEALSTVYDASREAIMTARLADDPELDARIKQQIAGMAKPSLAAGDTLYRAFHYRSRWAGFYSMTRSRVALEALIYEGPDNSRRHLREPHVPRVVSGKARGRFEDDYLPTELTYKPIKNIDSNMVHELLHYYSKIGRDGTYCGLSGVRNEFRWLNEAVTSRLELRVMRQTYDIAGQTGYHDHRRLYHAVRVLGEIDEDLFTAAYFEQPTKDPETGRILQPARRALNLAIRDAFGPGFMHTLTKAYIDENGQIDTGKALEFVEEARFRKLADYPGGEIDDDDLADWIENYKPSEYEPKLRLENLFKLRRVSHSGFEWPWRKKARLTKEAQIAEEEAAAALDMAGSIIERYRRKGELIVTAAQES